MRPFAYTINARRLELGLTYEQVHERLLGYDWPPGVEAPSISTVGHWFNGTRRPRDMEHLRGLCSVLETSVAKAMGEADGEAVTGMEKAMLNVVRDLDPEQVEALYAVAFSMKKKPAKPEAGS